VFERTTPLGTGLYGQLETAIREVYPYDVPEILAILVVAGSQSYLEWLNHQLNL
jgi:periplasmic divalent cation tolerance protein